MRKAILSLVLAVGATALTCAPVSANPDEIRLGILAPRGELRAFMRWTEFGSYLSTELGRPVKIVALPPPRVLPAARSGNVDFVLSHPQHTIALEEQLRGTPLATLNLQTGPRFAGVIIAKRGTGITHIEHLRGKHVMSMEFGTAAGAYIFQTYHLKQKGIDVHRDMHLQAGRKQDDLVFAVRAGVIDAAFVRTGLLESMQKEGKIRVDDFVVIDQRVDKDFPLLHSTVLYPEWCLTAVSPVAHKLAGVVRRAAVQLQPTNPAAQQARIVGFVAPLPLDEMKAALKSLEIEPYGNRASAKTAHGLQTRANE